MAHDCKVLTGVSGAVVFDGALEACVRFVGRLAAKYEPLRRAEKSGDRVVECFFALAFFLEDDGKVHLCFEVGWINFQNL